MHFYTKTDEIIATKAFALEEGELVYNSLLPSLLTGKGKLPEHLNQPFKPVSMANGVLQNKLSPEVCKSIVEGLQALNYSSVVFSHNFETYFVTYIRELFLPHRVDHYRPSYLDFCPIYAAYDFLSAEKVIELAMLHTLLTLIFKFKFDANKMKFIYQHLIETNSYGVGIPLSENYDSFLRYISRKKNEGLPKAIIHGLYDKPSNNHELTDLMKDVLILLATNVATSRSAYTIKEDLDHLIKNIPASENLGVYSVSESKIASFLNEPKAKALMGFAKDNPIEFRRRIIGVLHFLRASAPLVKVYIDGYTFQAEYKDPVTGKPDRLVGVVIQDDFSDCIIGHEIGSSENYSVLMRALQNMFKKTKNQIPREIVMDKFTFRMLSKNQALMDLLARYGLTEKNGIYVSSNPNRKSRLERFFNTLQQLFMKTLIHYIGPGITANKRSHSHPFKEFRIVLQKNLPERFELRMELDKLIRLFYNKEYSSPEQHDHSTPESRFNFYDSNPVGTFKPELLPILFFECHRSTVKGGAVYIKRGKNICIFYNRSIDFIKSYTGRQLFVFIDQDDSNKALVYEEDCKTFVCSLDIFKIIPGAAFDRSFDDWLTLQSFSKETKELIKQFEEEFKRIEETVFNALNGRDIKMMTKLATQKKAQTMDQQEAEVIGFTPKPETKLFHANKSRRKGRGDLTLEDMGIELVDTF